MGGRSDGATVRGGAGGVGEGEVENVGTTVGWNVAENSVGDIVGTSNGRPVMEGDWVEVVGGMVGLNVADESVG